jgi:UTP--glucose-1-phosphate uridylyltransferase
MKVVIPAAGLGKRFLPATKSMPKEMLPVLDRPIIHYVVKEAVEAGADDIVIITGRGKRAIEDYFDHNPEPGVEGSPELADLDALTSRVSIFYVRQRKPRGLADAIYCAKEHVGKEPFGVLLGDTINICDPPLLRQLHDKFLELGGKSSVIAVEKVRDEKVSDYGIVGGKEVSPGLLQIDKFVEKPALPEAPSRLGITGAYFLTPGIFSAIEETPPDKKGEIQLTTALDVLHRKEFVYALMLNGKRYDIGDKVLWLRTNVEFALKDPKLRPTLMALIHEAEQ